MDIIIIQTFEEFLTLEDEWNELTDQLGNRTLPLTHKWLSVWWPIFSVDESLHIICIREQEKLLAIAPLMITKRNCCGVSFKTTCLIENGYAPFIDVLFIPELTENKRKDIYNLMMDSITTDLSCFSKIPNENHFYTIATQDSNHSFGMDENLITPVIPTTGEWDDYFKSRPKKYRKSINRKYNRFKKSDEYSIEKHTLTSSNNNFMDEMCTVSSNSWKRKNNTDLSSFPGGKDFIFRLTDVYGPEGQVVLWFMRYQGIPISFEFHLIEKGVVYPLRADYDDRYKEHNPGTVLLYKVLEDCFADDSISEYFTCADEYEYLKYWTDLRANHVDIEVFRNGFKPNLFHLLKYRFTPILRNIKNKLFK